MIENSHGFLQNNLDALRTTAGAVPELRLDAARVRFEGTPAGPSASVRTADGRWIRLHSGRDPLAEAERLVSPLLAGTPPQLVVIVGAGLGYLVEVVERRSPSVRVLLVEPMPEVAAAMLARRDWQTLVESGRLRLLSGPAYAGAPDAWRFIGNDTDPPVLVAPVLEREFPHETARAREVVSQALFGARANADARRQFAPGYLTNTIRNMPAIARAADVDLVKRAFTGVPAIVVAAGPSLDRQVEALRTVGGRAIIIAVDTAVRPLLDAGVRPHLAVALDPGSVNGRHLTGLRDADETFLVAEGSLDPAALAAFDGRTFTFSVSDHHPWPWLRSVGVRRGGLRAWGSVLTSAVDLALQAGCDPIAFVGADLAYPGNRPYCRGTTFEEDWADRVAAGETLPAIWESALEAGGTTTVPGCDGHPIRTAARLLAFRDWIVRETEAATDRRFINTTRAGILSGSRIEQCELFDVAAELSTYEPLDPMAIPAVWNRGRHRTRDIRPALRDLLASIVDGTNGSDPLHAWLEFAGPALTRADVVRAVRAALETPRNRHAGCAASRSRNSRAAALPYAPERVALIRSAMLGDLEAAGVPASPLASETGGPTVTEAAARVRDTLRALLAAQGPLTAERSAEDVPHPRTLPAVRGLAWSERARPLARNFENALADLVVSELQNAEAAPEPAIANVDVHLSGGTATPGAAGTSWLSETDFDRVRVVLTVMADVMAVAARDRSGHVPSGLVAESAVPLQVASAVLGACSQARPPARDDAGPRQRILVNIAGTSHALVADAANLQNAVAEALAGLILVPRGDVMASVPGWWRELSITMAEPDASTPLQVTLVVEGAPGLADGAGADQDDGFRAWVRPLRIEADGLHYMVGNTLDREHALFAQVNGTCGLRIDGHGGWECDTPWPRPIAGLVRWGREGAIAWHTADTSTVMWRETADGSVHVEAAPFWPSLAAPQPDGSVWWTAFSGGLWSWTPGGAWRQVLATPPLMGLHVSPDRIRLDPAGEDSTFKQKPAVTDALIWRPGATRAMRQRLGPEGPCWSSSSAGGWTAAAYPYGDQIRLRRDDGVRLVLVCPGPFNLAWAGRSLVVSTLRGRLLVFRELLTWLQNEGPTATRPRGA